MVKKNHIVTTALFYANGPLHLGHMLEMIQADIWVRVLRRLGEKVIFISGDDQHGTPIMLQAEKKGLTPEQLIENIYQQHLADIDDFSIDFDDFYGTHSPESEKVVQTIFSQVEKHCSEREIEQAYDYEKQMFLPDRYIKGKCPKCLAPDQYGDHCEICSATYTVNDLIEPYSILTGNAPQQKKSKHLFFDLNAAKDAILSWQKSAAMPANVRNKLKEWMDDLHPWDITRDGPYFGFEIPGRSNQYFYVWLDAPIGYLGILSHHTGSVDLWNHEDTHITHFIGKDIINFHGLFWPGLLHLSGFRLPDQLRTHGFVTVNGSKMSKSRGTFITAKQLSEHIDPELLRYYFAAKLTNSTDDLDFSLDDFKNKVNAELVGKIVNLGNRLMGILLKHFSGELTDINIDSPLWQQSQSVIETLDSQWLSGDYQAAMRQLVQWVNSANQYVDAQQPWKQVKDPNLKMQAKETCVLGFNVFYQVMLQLSVVMPKMHARLTNALIGSESGQPLPSQQVSAYPRLAERITDNQIDSILQSDVIS